VGKLFGNKTAKKPEPEPDAIVEEMRQVERARQQDWRDMAARKQEMQQRLDEARQEQDFAASDKVQAAMGALERQQQAQHRAWESQLEDLQKKLDEATARGSRVEDLEMQLNEARAKGSRVDELEAALEKLKRQKPASDGGVATKIGSFFARSGGTQPQASSSDSVIEIMRAAEARQRSEFEQMEAKHGQMREQLRQAQEVNNAMATEDFKQRLAALENEQREEYARWEKENDGLRAELMKAQASEARADETQDRAESSSIVAEMKAAEERQQKEWREMTAANHPPAPAVTGPSSAAIVAEMKAAEEGQQKEWREMTAAHHPPAAPPPVPATRPTSASIIAEMKAAEQRQQQEWREMTSQVSPPPLPPLPPLPRFNPLANEPNAVQRHDLEARCRQAVRGRGHGDGGEVHDEAARGAAAPAARGVAAGERGTAQEAGECRGPHV
jgi:hypothetical protein